MSFIQQLYDQIRDKFAPGENFLLLKTGKNWDWPPNAGFVEKKEHYLVSTMPAPVVGERESPYYVPSGADIYDAYRTTLNSVKLDITEEFKAQLAEVDENITTTLKVQRDTYKKYQDAWSESGNDPSEKEEWKELNGWDVQLSLQREQLLTLQQRRQNILSAQTTDHNRALKAIKERKGFVKMYDGTKIREVPHFLVSENGIVWRDKVAGGKGNRIVIELSTPREPQAGSAVAGNNFLLLSTNSGDTEKGKNEGDVTKTKFAPDAKFFSFDVSEEISPPTTTLLGAATGSTGSTGSWYDIFTTPFITPAIPAIRADTESRSTSIRMTFEAATLVSVKPDPEWYHSAYINKIGQTRNWLDDRTSEDVFGPQGFHSIVTGFIAVYHPLIEITTRNESIRRNINSRTSHFSVGPFSFSQSAKEEEEEEEEEAFALRESGDTITIDSKSNYARIIGVIVQKP